METNQQNLFSYFEKPITNVLPTRSVSLPEVYGLIRGEFFLKRTSKLRDIEDPKLARKYKAKYFDYVTFSGVFKKRNEASLECHSGLMALDFDHVQELRALKRALINDPYLDTELLFTSPSGNGLKWIIAVDLSVVNHLAWFIAVTNYVKLTYNLQTDPSGKDVSRACFLSFDPEVYIDSKHLL